MRLGRAWVLAAVALASCSGAPEEAVPGQAQPAPPPSEQPFVVFAQRHLVIDQLGVPNAAPVTVGSSASPQTLRSDAPEIVEVDAAGALLGRRNGRALIRSANDASQLLEVEVRAAGALAVSPPAARIPPGGTLQLKLLAGPDGEELAGEAADWGSSSPEVAIVITGRVEAGRKPGTAIVTVSYGGQVATAQVVVAERPGPVFAVRPQAPSLRVGEAVTFEALSHKGPVAARWAPKGARLLAQSGPSTFVAVAPGRAQVCGEAGGKAACTTVTVRTP